MLHNKGMEACLNIVKFIVNMLKEETAQFVSPSGMKESKVQIRRRWFASFSVVWFQGVFIYHCSLPAQLQTADRQFEMCCWR